LESLILDLYDAVFKTIGAEIMKHKILTLFVVGLALSISAEAYSQGRSAGAGKNQGQRPTTGQYDKRDTQRERAEIRRLEAEGKRATAEAQNRSEQMRGENPPNEHADDAAFSAEQNVRGNERAEEMHDHRDEGKAIKEQYREGREPGQEGADSDAGKADVADEQQEKAKKPWWKFWDG